MDRDSAIFDDLVAILRTATSQAQARTLDELAELCACSRRQVEHVIETRFADFPFALVAGDRGYHQPEDADQLNRYLSNLQSRAVKIFLRKRRAAVLARRSGWPRQGKAFVDPPARQLELIPT